MKVHKVKDRYKTFKTLDTNYENLYTKLNKYIFIDF